MDNNPNSVQQPDQDTPVFRSSDLTQTKARKDTQYFTNVHKATLGQKLSDWFHKVNRESLEHSAARKAALKAKLAERQRAADLASISLPTTPARPRSSTSFPTTTPPTPAPAPAAPTTPTPAPTVIIETPSRPPRNKKLIIIIILAIIGAILILGLIITLLIVRPWDSQPSIVSLTGQVIELKDGEPIGNLDMATANDYDVIAFRTQILNSTTLDVYTDSQPSDGDTRSPYIIADNIDKVLEINQVTDPSTILLFELEKARIFIIYEDYDSALEILSQISEDDLYASQLNTFFSVMQFYYTAIDDTDLADEYTAKIADLPIDQRGDDGSI